MIYMTWQDKVKNLMVQNGLNQKQLAQCAGITEASVSRYLKGERAPRTDTIIKLAKVFNVSVEYLLTDVEASLSPFDDIATTIVINRDALTVEEKIKLISLIVGKGK